MNQLLIVLEGTDKRVIKKNVNGIVISKTDKVVITAGHILRDSGHSNILEIFNVKDILN